MIDHAALVAFLRARLDEDEQIAQAARGHIVEAVTTDEAECHSRRWRTARVLAEVEAKRQLLVEHDAREVASLDRDTWGRPFLACRRCRIGGRQIVAPCTTLRLLALPYAGHPDYREEWRP